MKKSLKKVLAAVLAIVVFSAQAICAYASAYDLDRDIFNGVSFSADYGSFRRSDIMSDSEWLSLCGVLDRWYGYDVNYSDDFQLAYEFVMQQLYYTGGAEISRDPKGLINYGFCVNANSVDYDLKTHFNFDDVTIKKLHSEIYRGSYMTIGYYYNGYYYVDRPEGTLQGSLYSVKVMEKRGNLYKIRFVNQDFREYGVNDPSMRETYYCVFGVINGNYRIYGISDYSSISWPRDTYRNGDVIGQACYTDISSDINGYDIASYNVNGYTYIIAEDLKNYGFDVVWNEKSRILSIKRNGKNYVSSTYKTPYVSPSKVGMKSHDLLYTDIQTSVNDSWVQSYNINGRTIIQIESLNCFGSIWWSPYKKTISLNISGLSMN